MVVNNILRREISKEIFFELCLRLLAQAAQLKKELCQHVGEK